MSGVLTIRPLTAEAFAPYGEVVAPRADRMRLINGGTTERYHALSTAEAAGEGARVILNIFRGEARRFPYALTMVERHPLGSQSFQPLSDRPFLVVARNGQGINYRRNVWHHPLMALGKPSDFLVVDREGPGNNLEEYFYETSYLIEEPR